MSKLWRLGGQSIVVYVLHKCNFTEGQLTAHIMNHVLRRPILLSEAGVLLMFYCILEEYADVFNAWKADCSHCPTSDINCKELGSKQKANPQKHNVRL